MEGDCLKHPLMASASHPCKAMESWALNPSKDLALSYQPLSDHFPITQVLFFVSGSLVPQRYSRKIVWIKAPSIFISLLVKRL